MSMGCTCPAVRNIEFNQAVISVKGNAQSVKPNDSVFHVQIFSGITTNSRIGDDLNDLGNSVCEFDIYGCLDEWEESPHIDLVREYLTYCSDAQRFKHFRGLKAYQDYILVFDTLVEKILSIVPVQDTSKKTNPHVTKRQKKK